MKKSRLAALLLAVSMVLSLTACGTPTDTAEAAPTQAASAQAEAETPAPANDPVPAASAAEASVQEPSKPQYTVEYPLNTDVTLTMLAKLEQHMQSIIENYGDVLAMQKYMEDTGVQVNFKMLGDAVFDEQLNLLISSGDLPDMVQGGMAGYGIKLSAAIEDEVLMDIAPLLPEYAPDYYAHIRDDQSFRENVLNDNDTTSMFAGVGIPVIDAGLFVRGDWMDELKLEEPETVSDLHEIMKQFQSKYGSTMGILITSELSSGLEAAFNTTQNGLSALSMQLTAPDSGEVVSGIASEGYFDYLTFLRTLYSEGLINGDFTGISKMLGTYNSTYWNGTTGVWNEGNRCVDPAEYSNSADPNYQPRPIKMVKTDDGEGTHVVGLGSTVGRGAVYITAKCENPEVAVSFMNYAYTDAGIDVCSFGIEGETFERVSEDEVHYTDLISNNPDYEEREAEVFYLINNWMPSVQTQAMYNLKNSVKEVREAADLWTENCGDGSMKLPDGVTLNDSDTETVYGLAVDVLTLLSERAASYVMGNIDEASFHTTISEAEAMGLTEITDIYQAAYDDYMAG